MCNFTYIDRISLPSLLCKNVPSIILLLRLFSLPHIGKRVYFDIDASNLEIKHKGNVAFTKKAITCIIITSNFFLIENVNFQSKYPRVFSSQQTDIRERLY